MQICVKFQLPNFSEFAGRATASFEQKYKIVKSITFGIGVKQRSGGRRACMPDIFLVTRKANLYGVASYLAYSAIRVQWKN